MPRLDEYIGKEDIEEPKKEISVREAAQFLLHQIEYKGCLSPCTEYDNLEICNCNGIGLAAIKKIAEEGYDHRGEI